MTKISKGACACACACGTSQSKKSMQNCSFVNLLLRALEYIVLGVGALVAPFCENSTFCRGWGRGDGLDTP